MCLSIYCLNSQTLIKEIAPGSQGSNPTFIDSIGEGFLFYGFASQYGDEMYFTDGTTNGTFLLKDIAPTSFSSKCEFSNVKMNGNVYFFANDTSVLRYGLWMTDGTKTGTKKIKSISRYSFPQNDNNKQNIVSQITVFKNKIYMTIKDEINGYELWVSDGTDTGTHLLLDIFEGFSNGNPRGYFEYKDHLYFIASDLDHGTELWRTDGTKEGTELFIDLFPGNVSGFINYNPYFFEINDKLYFRGRGSYAESEELWVTDGTLAGTKLFKDFNKTFNFSSNLKLIAQNKDYVIFSASDINNINNLWKFDGTDTTGLSLLFSISGTSDFSKGFILGNSIIFPAFVNSFGYEYWVTDGTDSGTKLLADINPGNNTGYVGFETIIGNRMYMIGQVFISEINIWTSDGTNDSTYTAFKLTPKISRFEVSSFFTFRNQLYAGILTNSASLGIELYRFDTNKFLSITNDHLKDIELFPNPVKTGTYLNVSGISENAEAMILDITGKYRNTYILENGKILITNDIPPGLYFLRVIEGNKIYNFKINIMD